MGWLYGIAIFFCGMWVANILIHKYWRLVSMQEFEVEIRHILGHRFKGFIVEKSEYEAVMDIVMASVRSLDEEADLNKTRDDLRNKLQAMAEVLERNSNKFGRAN